MTVPKVQGHNNWTNLLIQTRAIKILNEVREIQSNYFYNKNYQYKNKLKNYHQETKVRELLYKNLQKYLWKSQNIKYFKKLSQNKNKKVFYKNNNMKIIIQSKKHQLYSKIKGLLTFWPYLTTMETTKPWTWSWNNKAIFLFMQVLLYFICRRLHLPRKRRRFLKVLQLPWQTEIHTQDRHCRKSWECTLEVQTKNNHKSTFFSHNSDVKVKDSFVIEKKMHLLVTLANRNWRSQNICIAFHSWILRKTHKSCFSVQTFQW